MQCVIAIRICRYFKDTYIALILPYHNVVTEISDTYSDSAEQISWCKWMGLEAALLVVKMI